MTEIIQVCLLDFNKGQLTGLPKNPRFFRDYRFEAMKKSIQDSPEMLELRELIVFPYNDGRYIVVCGNLRLRACKYGAQNETYIEGWEKKTSNLLIYKRLCNV